MKGVVVNISYRRSQEEPNEKKEVPNKNRKRIKKVSEVVKFNWEK